MGEPDPKPDPDELGEKGKEAIKAERERTKAAEQAKRDAEAAAKKAQEERDALQARIEKLENEGKSDTEKAIAAARKEAADEARKEEREKAAEKDKQAAEREKTLLLKQVKVDVEAAAVGKLADPKDAVLHLDLEDLADDDGNVDDKKVGEALKKLLEAKPYLKASGVKPDVGGGARPGGGSEPSRSERAKALAARTPGARAKAGDD